MKKLIALVLVIVCTLSLFACAAKENDEQENPKICSKIRLIYHGNSSNDIMIEDSVTCSELMGFISKAGGTEKGSTKGNYGVPYTLVVYFDGEEKPLSFMLWSDKLYSTRDHIDSEGYPIFFEDDLSDMYQYLTDKYPEDFWYGETEHTHQWQDVSGEHARICTECNEKQLKPEACNFVRTYCDQPMECTICHATDESTERHDWKYVSEVGDCWSTNITYVCSKCNMEQVLHGDTVLPYHSWEDKTVDDKTTFVCSRCNESNTFESEIAEFSYTEVLEKYKIGDPGVEHENLNSFFEFKITGANDAVTMAKFELTVEYDTIAVSFDKDSDVWCVDFYTSNTDGGGQSVYIKGNGLTCYIVYGK